MAAREISIFSGVITQSGPDNDADVSLPIIINGRRAIQLYKIELSVDASILYGAVGGFAIIAGASATNLEVGGDVFTSKIMDFSKSLIGSPAAGLSGFDMRIDWFAPPGLIITRKFLRIWIETFGTGVSNEIDYRVYYKPVQLTDVQALQLRLF